MKIAMNLLKADHVGVRELKTNLSRRLKTDRPLVVTDHNQPVKVILSYNDMLDLLDMLDEMADEATVALVREGRRAIKAGAKGIPVSRLFSKMRKK